MQKVKAGSPLVLYTEIINIAPVLFPSSTSHVFRWLVRGTYTNLCVTPRPSSPWPSQTTRGPTLKQTPTASPAWMRTRFRWRITTMALRTWWTVGSSASPACLSPTVTCTEPAIWLKHICPCCLNSFWTAHFQINPPKHIKGWGDICKTLFFVEEVSKDGFQRSDLQRGKLRMPWGETVELEQNGADRLTDLTARIVAILFLTICFLKKIGNKLFRENPSSTI